MSFDDDNDEEKVVSPVMTVLMGPTVSCNFTIIHIDTHSFWMYALPFGSSAMLLCEFYHILKLPLTKNNSHFFVVGGGSLFLSIFFHADPANSFRKQCNGLHLCVDDDVVIVLMKWIHIFHWHHFIYIFRPVFEC